jgi:hypothetical protein
MIHLFLFWGMLSIINPLPILFTEDGIIIDVSESQLTNANLQIISTEGGIVIDFNAMHLLNALL